MDFIQEYARRAVREAVAADVLEGYKLVPIEPTEPMMRVAVIFLNGGAVYKNVNAEVLKIEEQIHAETYSSMLAAAPQPQPVVQQVQAQASVELVQEEKPLHPSFAPFKCPACGSSYFGPLWKGIEHVGRYCKGWPSIGYDRSYKPCKGNHEEMFAQHKPANQQKE